MPIKFSNDKPIFLQVAEILKAEIISGKYGPNEKLPSVRDLAQIFLINPNTIQKALQLLEDDGLIITDRTNGKFISITEDEIKSHQQKTISQELDLFVERMHILGLTNSEIKNLINNIGD